VKGEGSFPCRQFFSRKIGEEKQGEASNWEGGDEIAVEKTGPPRRGRRAFHIRKKKARQEEEKKKSGDEERKKEGDFPVGSSEKKNRISQDLRLKKLPNFEKGKNRVESSRKNWLGQCNVMKATSDCVMSRREDHNPTGCGGLTRLRGPRKEKRGGEKRGGVLVRGAKHFKVLTNRSLWAVRKVSIGRGDCFPTNGGE